MKSSCIPWAEIPEMVLPDSTSRRTFEGEGATLVMVRIPQGFITGRQSHPHEQFMHVLSGRGRLSMTQGDCAFNAGCIMHFPIGTSHSIQFDTDSCAIETNLPA